jgi:hypothetical protein
MSDFALQIKRIATGPAQGLELGHMSFVGPGGTISSESSGKSMMIYLSLVGLVDGLLALKQPGHSQFEFIGDDSSFRVMFRKRGSTIEVADDEHVVARLPIDQIIEGAKSGAEVFLSDPANRLTQDDLPFEDLRASLSEIGISI